MTAESIIAIAPKTVRIYPAITLKGTLLERFFNEGKYTPPSLDETVELCAKLYAGFMKNGIRVIRLGLHSIEKRIICGRSVASVVRRALREQDNARSAA